MVKGAGKKLFIRKKIMTDDVVIFFTGTRLFFASFSTFESGTILNPHRDPDVYPCRYKRIQLPLKIPDKNHCFMIWDGRKFLERGRSHNPVMDVTHEVYNLSTKSMEFVMIDVKLDTVVEYES